MNCREFRQYLDEFLAGALSASAVDAANEHLHGCPDCQRQLAKLQSLRAALRSQEIPAARPGFFDEALRQARQSAPASVSRWPRLVGAALAASLVLWFGYSWVPVKSPGSGVDRVAAVTIKLHETRVVQLAFNAEEAIAGATLRIQLPEGVELQGFPGKREIEWRTDLARGVNMLSLPLTAVAASEGALRARVEQGERSTELMIGLSVQERV